MERGVVAALKDSLPSPMQRRLAGCETDYPSYLPVKMLMDRYQVKDLVGADPASFKATIDRFLDLSDASMEGYNDTRLQRDLSIKFHWGHNHDFGDFALQGRMGNRHIALLAAFIDEMGALPMSLDGRKVLDIGCWTGGASLLLAAMGAEVVAIDEVKKYVDSLNYLRDAFGVERLEARNLSLYDLSLDDAFLDAFDLVLFAGVLYHLSDPVIGLRITFNTLKVGGRCLLESATMPSLRRILRYTGPGETIGGTTGERNRGGWNWFRPSPPTIRQMMTDVGYANIRLSPVRWGAQGFLHGFAAGRVYAVGDKTSHVDIARAGLSTRAIR